jgi:hypothetical protein
MPQVSLEVPKDCCGCGGELQKGIRVVICTTPVWRDGRLCASAYHEDCAPDEFFDDDDPEIG